MSSSPPEPEELPVEVLTEEDSITSDTDSLPSLSQESLVMSIKEENVKPISPSAAPMNDEEFTGMCFSSNSGQDIKHLDSKPSSSANPRKRKRSAKASNNHRDFFIEYLQRKKKRRENALKRVNSASQALSYLVNEIFSDEEDDMIFHFLRTTPQLS